MLAALSFWAAERRDSLAAAATHSPQPAERGTALLLDVYVNGVSIGLLGEFREIDGKLYIKPKELGELGFRLPPGTRTTGPDKLVALAKLPGVSARIDESTQSIYITAPLRALKPNEIGAPESLVSTLPVKSSTGGVVNYDLSATYAEHRFLGDMFFDGRVFSPWGVAESSFTATNARGFQAAPIVRLDSAVTASDTAKLTQYQLGDLITGGLDWSRPVRLGGFQISTNFGIRPDLVTFPVPSITGSVAVPSSVDVLVNGVEELSQSVPAGPFEIRQLPVVSGVGNVSVITRNAAGQQTTQTLQLYTSHQLVAPGLNDFSAEIGLLRLNYGTRSNDYHAPAASGSYRRGLTTWLTLEAHAEGTNGGRSYEGLKIQAGGMGGGGAVIGLGTFGVITGDIAASRFGRRSGSLASVGFERIAQHVSVSLSAQATEGAFRDIAALYGDPVPTLQARAVLGLSWSVIGSFGVAYTVQRTPASLAQTLQSTLGESQATNGDEFGIVPLALPTRSSLISVSYSRPLLGQRAFLAVTGFHDFANSASTGASLVLTIPLGHRSGLSVEGDGDPGGKDGVVQMTQSAVEIGDTGYQLREEGGEQSRQLAMANYRASWGLIDGGIDHAGTSTSLRGDLQGAVAYAGGGVFPSLPITDSFAVVDTDGVAGIHILQENRPVGTTNGSGRLLVPDLRAFDANRLGVDPNDIPIDAEIGDTSQLVRPRDRSGVVVHFKVKPSQGAIVILHDRAGKPVQLGSNARLDGRAGAVALVVGYDGEVFVTGLGPHNRLSVLRKDGSRCVADFDFAPKPRRIPRIGPVICRPAPP
jgi:outer membrane usher protein